MRDNELNCGVRISDSDRYKRSRTYSNTATTVLCFRGCYSDDWIGCLSHVLIVTDTTGEALQLPLSHICFTHFVFTIRLLLEYSRGNFADFVIMIMQVMGTVSVLL